MSRSLLYSEQNLKSLLEHSLLKVFIIVINIELDGSLKTLPYFFFFHSGDRTRGNQCPLHLTNPLFYVTFKNAGWQFKSLSNEVDFSDIPDTFTVSRYKTQELRLS